VAKDPWGRASHPSGEASSVSYRWVSKLLWWSVVICGYLRYAGRHLFAHHNILILIPGTFFSEQKQISVLAVRFGRLPANGTVKNIGCGQLPFAAVMLLKRICVGFSLSLYPDFFPLSPVSVGIFQPIVSNVMLLTLRQLTMPTDYSVT